jgi:hypothetical protein
MKKAGAEIVSRDAVEQLLFYLEERAKKLTASALKLAKHSKRKKITQRPRARQHCRRRARWADSHGTGDCIAARLR